jgi:hypothetical protein
MKITSFTSLLLTTCLSSMAVVSINVINIPWMGAGSAVAQVTSDAFKKDASAATSKFNNVNLACAAHTKSLYSFVQTNASKYKIVKYQAYKIVAPGPLAHEDYKAGNASITQNGIHYFLDIDSYAFDNHHPTGKLGTDFIKGFSATGKTTITPISIAEIVDQQC